MGKPGTSSSRLTSATKIIMENVVNLIQECGFSASRLADQLISFDAVILVDGNSIGANGVVLETHVGLQSRVFLPYRCDPEDLLNVFHRLLYYTYTREAGGVAMAPSMETLWAYTQTRPSARDGTFTIEDVRYCLYQSCFLAGEFCDFLNGQPINPPMEEIDFSLN